MVAIIPKAPNVALEAEAQAFIAQHVNTNTALTLGEVRAFFSRMNQDAKERGDEQSRLWLRDAWQKVKGLAAEKDILNAVAVGAILAEREAERQHHELAHAVRYQDAGHPLVGGLIRGAHGENEYNRQIDAWDGARGDTVLGVQRILMETCGLNEHDAIAWSRLFVYGDASFLPPDAAAAIGQAMRQIMETANV